MGNVIDDIRNKVWSPTPQKSAPDETADKKDPPGEKLEGIRVPSESLKPKDKPKETVKKSPALNKTLDQIDSPEETLKEKELPPDYNPLNTVFIGNTPVEIKSTLLGYFRNGATAGYSYLKNIPLNTLAVLQKGVLDPERSGDQLIFDFLVAVFDSLTFVKRNYNNITAENIDKILEIFGRINGIEKREEEARKNREAAQTR